MQPNKGHRKEPSSSPWQKNTWEFPSLFTLKPKEAIILLCLPVSITMDR